MKLLLLPCGIAMCALMCPVLLFYSILTPGDFTSGMDLQDLLGEGVVLVLRSVSYVHHLFAMEAGDSQQSQHLLV